MWLRLQLTHSEMATSGMSAITKEEKIFPTNKYLQINKKLEHIFLSSRELWSTPLFCLFTVWAIVLSSLQLNIYRYRYSGHIPQQLFCAIFCQPSSSLKEKTLAGIGSIPLQLQYKSSGVFASLNWREKQATGCWSHEMLALVASILQKEGKLQLII